MRASENETRMDQILKENERIDDLERNGYRIIQNKSRFCFGMDAVLLSGFACEGETGTAWKNAGNNGNTVIVPGTEEVASVPEKSLRIADLGTGTGILPLLLHGKLTSTMSNAAGAAKVLRASDPANAAAVPEVPQQEDPANATGMGRESSPWIVGLEIQEEMADMASRSVQLNGLEGEIQIVRGDICRASQLLGKGEYDVVTSNPPYMKSGGGISNPDSSKAISRHEILCTFEDVARETAALLKTGGRFYLVHRPQRLAELICTLKEHKLEPKRLRMVHSFVDSEAVMVLLEAAKGGRPFLKVERPLIIYREKGVYTEEIRWIYQF